MDPATKLRVDTPLLRVYDDGRVERLFGTDTTPPGFDAATGVTSKDVVIDAATGVFVRLYIPDIAASASGTRKKLPIVVYFHGGGLVLDSAVSPTYHRYLNSVVSKAGVLAVSVNYRLAPEHPLPAAYDDCRAALNWCAASSRADPWLSEHSDTGRIFLAGDSGGANIVHNIAIMAGAQSPSEPPVEEAILLHPMFGGKEPIDGEAMETGEIMAKVWPLICPEASSTEGLDDQRLNPVAEGAPSLQTLACRKLLICSAERDYTLPRAVAYYQAVKASGWPGTVEWLESKGEEHVFFLGKPECDEAVRGTDGPCGHLP